MKLSILIGMAFAVLGGLCGGAVADEKADAAINELDKQFVNVKSYSAKTEAMTDAEFGPGHTSKKDMAGTSEWMRKGDTVLVRADMKCKTVATEGGNTTTTHSTLTTVNDGKFLYAVTDEDGKKTVVKNKAPAASSYQPKGYFALFKSYYEIKLLNDEQVNDADCCVFEIKMKPMEGAPPGGRQLVYFWKGYGIQIKSEGFDAGGKLISSSISTDIKINVDLSADRFAFKIPEGAQVVDTTGVQPQPAQTEPVTESKAEPEKVEGKKKKKKGIKLPKLPKWP